MLNSTRAILIFIFFPGSMLAANLIAERRDEYDPTIAMMFILLAMVVDITKLLIILKFIF